MKDIHILIEHANQLIDGMKVDNLNLPRYDHTKPKHLLYDVRRITHAYREDNYVSQEDMDYLQQLYHASPQFLMNNVYVLGEWYAFRSYKHRNYNLKKGTTPTKVAGFINY